MNPCVSIPAEDGLPPIHPGEILLEEFMLPLKLSANALAIALCVPAPRINDIVHGKRGVTADTAMRLARYFGTSPELWMNLQTSYDLKISQQSLQATLARITPRLQAA
ncbi:transcriptional regulator [Betaproteobacteria bacterium]|nr:transcriptional regulator [Betaproteobacteria bacterium]